MTTQKIGSLLKIRGQVVRTHPVHPELINGTFICLECQAVIKDVEQQMKFTQVDKTKGNLVTFSLCNSFNQYSHLL